MLFRYAVLKINTRSCLRRLLNCIWRRAITILLLMRLQKVRDFLPESHTDTLRIKKTFREKNLSWERLNISIGLMENYCHAYIENKFNENELKYMREETIRIIGKLMWEDDYDF